jgi:predicted ester cyclase
MGPAGVKERIRAYRAAMPDLHISIEDVISENDRVVTRWVLRGRHSGKFEDVDGGGASVEVSGTTIHRISNLQIVEQWVNWDTETLRNQMRLVRE